MLNRSNKKTNIFFSFLAFLIFSFSNLAFSEQGLNLYTDSAQAPEANLWLSDSKNSFGNNQEFLSAEEAFMPDILQDEKFIDLVFNISDLYYIYRDSIKIETPNGELKIEFPPALDKTDEHYGATKIYRNQLVLKFAKEEFKPNSVLKLRYQGCADAGLCYPPQTKFLQIDSNLQFQLTEKPVEKMPKALVAESELNQAKLNSGDFEKPTGAYSDEYADALQNKGIFTILAIFFVGGLLLAFTPCVLPMLPIISALVVGKNKTKFQALNLSLAYVLGMALSYAMLGSLSGALGGFLNLQTALQSAWVLVPFGILFIILSLPLFGVFELQLPSSWQEKIIARQNKISGKGSFLTTVAIGFLAALVVSPCLSAPLVAALSFVAQSGNGALGGFALFASGLGMGVPLVIFATLGAAYLPKSGIWMEKVKNIFGIAMLFMAIYMLRLWLSASLVLVLSGMLLFASAYILYAKKPLAFVSSLLIGIYSLALIFGGLMGNSSFTKPLQINLQGATSFLDSENVYDANVDIKNHEGLEKTKSDKNWIQVANIADLNEQLNSNPNNNLVLISAEWCANCKVIKKQILQDADLKKATGAWRLIEVDTTNPNSEMLDFLKSKNIFGPPTFLFYQGVQEVADLRLQGIIAKKEIIARLMAN